MVVSGIVVLLVAVIAARWINERGFRTLTDEEKLRLIDGFSRQRAYSLIPIVALIGVYFFLSTQVSVSNSLLTAGYIGLLFAYVVVRSILNHLKLRQLGMPDRYRKCALLSQTLSMLGVAWCLFTLVGH
jgi:hypothetical protein